MLRMTSPRGMEMRRAMRLAAADAAVDTTEQSGTDDEYSRPATPEPRQRPRASSLAAATAPTRASTPSHDAGADMAEHKSGDEAVVSALRPLPPDPPAEVLLAKPPLSVPSIGGGVIPELDEPPCVRPANANRNSHLTGLLVFGTTLAAMGYWLYKWFSPREVDMYFPLYLFGALAILFYATFVVTIVVNSVLNVFMPVEWVQQNSTFYSAKPVALPWAHRWKHRENSGTTQVAPGVTPEPSSASTSSGYQLPRQLIPIASEHRLPRVVATMPVYTEDFELTIRPSIENTMVAGRAYAQQYRTASFGFFVNEDGLQVIPEEQRQQRIDWYMQQPDLCFIARGAKGRAGRFKKASNMNFCLRWLRRALVHSKEYGVSLNESLRVLGAEHGFIAGAGAQFSADTLLHEPLGSYMLLLDSDSRMSSNAIFPLVSEMELDPSVGFLQCFTRPMLISHDYFEELIGVFTERIFAISFMFSCSNGSPAPLIGHNALLRCLACEKVAWYDDQGAQMFWAEDKVSEVSSTQIMQAHDFDMSMRLSSAGYSGRYIGFDLGFSEGVSLTVLEELSRWSKYTFGVNELMFHPLAQWHKKGVLAPTLVNFVTSTSISWYAKFGALAYMGSFYAMAVGPPVTLLNYWALAYSLYWQQTVGGATVDIFLTCICVFGLLLPISNLVVMWRFKLNRPGGFWSVLAREIPYSLFMSVLFSGMPYHICSAILHHFLSIPISWSTTTKEAHESTRWIEIKNTLSHFRTMYLFGTLSIGMMAAMYWLPPPAWRIQHWQCVVPLLYFCIAHMTAPLLLNPIVMRGQPKPKQPPAPPSSKGVTVV